MSNPAIRAIIQALPDQRIRLDPVMCTDTSPFEVEVAGSGVSVAAERFEGSTFSLNERGYCIWVPGHTLPLCFTTS